MVDCVATLNSTQFQVFREGEQSKGSQGRKLTLGLLGFDLYRLDDSVSQLMLDMYN